MPARIRSAAFVGRTTPLTRGSISLAVKAGRKCISSAGIDPSDIGLLIFCGIYRDENIGEPAIASLIQSKLGLNLLSDGKKATFAFDILNSGCGVITAMHVADSHLRSQPAGYALIVAADSIPDKGHTKGFPFQPAGGAILLEWSSDKKGIIDFRFDTYPTEKEVFRSFIEYNDGKDGGVRKGQYLRFEEDPQFLRKSIPAAVGTVDKLLSKNSIGVRDVDMFLTSQRPTGFPKEFEKGIGVEGKTVDLTTTYGNVHTASLAACLDKVMVNDRLPPNKTMVLVNIGSGISVASALIRT